MKGLAPWPPLPSERKALRLATDGKTVIYNARLGQRFKLFTVDATDPARKTQLSFGESDDLSRIRHFSYLTKHGEAD